MKKIFLISLLFVTASAVDAATPWWEQQTVCRLNPASCYTAMGSGYDSGMWDAGAGCWGMKWICGEALTNTDSATLVGRMDIASGTNINSDYDLNVLNGDCFGMRKTSTDGSMASVNGRMVRVWCPGILDNPDDVIENGEITYGTQPTCNSLRADGYVAVATNQKCYGKHYDHYILCDGETPTLVVLNGATDYGETASPSSPLTQEEADALFNSMYENIHQ